MKDRSTYRDPQPLLFPFNRVYSPSFEEDEYYYDMLGRHIPDLFRGVDLGFFSYGVVSGLTFPPLFAPLTPCCWGEFVFHSQGHNQRLETLLAILLLPAVPRNPCAKQ